MKKALFILSSFLVATSPLLSEERDVEFDKRHILYLMSTNQPSKAVDEYLAFYQKEKKHDLKILEQIGNILLDIGSSSMNIEDQMLTLYGIGLSGSKGSLHFLESALKSHFPVVQAAALHLLAQIHEDAVDDILTIALHSDFLMIRIEALFYLVARKTKHALGHVESLCNLLPPQARPYFVEFYALYASNDSIQSLKKFINDKDLNVRISAIAAAASHNRDDLLPSIRTILSQSEPSLKEVAAFALGHLHDLNSIQQLKIASSSPFIETKLAALFSLFKLGDREAGTKILEIAKEGNPFAILLAGQMPDSDFALLPLIHHIDPVIRLNAAAALLGKRRVEALPVITTILESDPDYMGIIPYVSPGKSLVALKPIPTSAIPNEDIRRNIKAITLSFQEEFLKQCIELPEKEFLKLARKLMDTKKGHLIPLLTHLIENMGTEASKELLIEKSQQVGYPLLRGYCSLSLYRIGEEEVYRKRFLNWLSTQKGVQLIEFKPMMDRGAREDKNMSNYQLSAEEKSGLLIESFDAIATKHDIDGISLILEAIRDGHEKNRYAFAGLLLKSIH
jgi:HEAT repeat protein